MSQPEVSEQKRWIYTCDVCGRTWKYTKPKPRSMFKCDHVTREEGSRPRLKCVHQEGATMEIAPGTLLCGAPLVKLIKCKQRGELVSVNRLKCQSTSELQDLLTEYHGESCETCDQRSNGLDQVMLACVDCVDPEAGARALWKSMQKLEFASVKLFSHERPEDLPTGIEWVEIWPLLDINEYNVFMLRDFHRHVDTPHVLTVQEDGYVVNPQLWDPSWLKYDYIGAPWPTHMRCAGQNRVGNSGFCLRSKRLFEVTSALASDEAIAAHRRTTSMTRAVGQVFDDVFTCSTQLDAMAERGVRIAPINVAARFAFERQMSEATGQTFGFHGTHTEKTKQWCDDLASCEIERSMPSGQVDSVGPSLSLACVDCVDPAAGARALWKSMQKLRFASVKLFSHERPGNLPDGIQWVEIPKLQTLDDYNVFILRDFHRHVDTSHVLTVQADGWIIHPELWDPAWLEYDYIGPPWEKLRSYAEKNRVGGSGFCLRSKRFLLATSKLATSAAFDRHRTMTGGPILDDIFAGWTHYDDLCDQGMKFAPIEQAARFAFENVVLEVRSCSSTFGFHGTHTEQTKRLCEGIHIMRRLEDAVAQVKTRPVLSIMLAALHSRDWIFAADAIREQIGDRLDVELCVMADGGTATSGWKRNRLMDMANGEYLAFVDDDDEISVDYVKKLLEGCRSGKDVITFDLARKSEGKITRQTFGVDNTDHQFVDGVEHMVVNHLCAWRRNLAMAVRYDERLGYGDDQLWYKPLVACHPDLTEHHIDDVLYTYVFDWSSTVNQQSKRRIYTKRLYQAGAQVFRRGEEILVARDSDAAAGAVVTVRDKKNRLIETDRSTMEYVTTVYVR